MRKLKTKEIDIDSAIENVQEFLILYELPWFIEYVPEGWLKALIIKHVISTVDSKLRQWAYYADRIKLQKNRAD